MYSREVNGQVLEFGVSGKLIMNVLVMYDRQSDSLWSQLLGEAVEGKFKGQKLEFLPSWHTTWEDWKTRYPETLALVKEFVIGVSLGEAAVAYPFRELNDMPVVNDVVNEIPILVTFDAETASGVVFERMVDGRTLTFQPADDLKIRDEETGTLWNGLSGEAISGELEGEQLERVKSTQSFWFGWKDFYPETRVYGQGD